MVHLFHSASVLDAIKTKHSSSIQFDVGNISPCAWHMPPVLPLPLGAVDRGSDGEVLAQPSSIGLEKTVFGQPEIKQESPDMMSGAKRASDDVIRETL